MADLSSVLWLTALLAALICSAMVSSMETAYTGASKARLTALAKQGDLRAAAVLRLLEKPETFMSAFLLVNNLCNTVSSAAVTAVFLHYFGNEGVLYAVPVAAVLIIVFAEIMPKTIALNHPNEAALWLIGPARVITVVCQPVAELIRQMTRGVLHLFGVNTKNAVDASQLIRSELMGAIDLSHSAGGVEREEKERLGGLLNLNDLDVSQVMIHRKNMTVLDVREPPERLVRQILSTPYTRIPLYRDNPENIVGVLHAKDILRAVVRENPDRLNDLKIAAVMRKPWFIPNTTSVSDQLNRFLTRRNHFAVVVDEYGALQGLVTLEDILEEIVGDIRDEHDAGGTGIRPQGEGVYVVDGKVHIRDFNRRTGTSFPDDKAVTLAGLVIDASRCIPERGQTFYFYDHRFEVLERERNQITVLRVSVEAAPTTEDAGA